VGFLVVAMPHTGIRQAQSADKVKPDEICPNLYAFSCLDSAPFASQSLFEALFHHPFQINAAIRMILTHHPRDDSERALLLVPVADAVSAIVYRKARTKKTIVRYSPVDLR